MSFNQSEVLKDFGRILQEKDQLKKIAQVVVLPLSEQEKLKLQAFLGQLAQQPSNGPGMEKWINRLKGQSDPYQKEVLDALSARYQLWARGKDATEVSAIPLPGLNQQNVATQPLGPENVATPHRASLSGHGKTAQEYGVGVKEDIVDKAHPKSAVVSGDVVENLNEQQDADKEVAEKSASVLVALYKLAKTLQADKNETAYKIVKAACLDIAKTLKK